MTPIIFQFWRGLLSSLFSKNPSKCLKTAIFPQKLPKGLKTAEIAVLRHLEGFFDKSEEKLKNNGGLHSITIF